MTDSPSGNEPAGADGPAERRYSNREFSLIMGKAYDLEERLPQPTSARDGLTLEEMRSIALEVGLDPAALVRAADLVPAERSGAAARALGAPEAFTYELRLDAALDDEARDVLLQTVRRVLSQRGETRLAGDVLEWKSVGRSDHVWLTVASRGGRTVIELTGDRRPSLLVSLLFPALFWGALATALAMTSTLAAGAFLLPVGFVIATLATARLSWRAASRRLRARLERLAIALRADATRLAIEPGASPDR